MVDFLAPLDLNHEKRPLGLDQKINLAFLESTIAGYKAVQLKIAKYLGVIST